MDTGQDGAGLARGARGDDGPTPPQGRRDLGALPDDPSRNTLVAIGRSVHLPRRVVDQAVVAHVARVLSARGVQVPSDPVDFLNRARVHLEDDGAAIVTWEE